jgi:hypothetical protein
MLPFLIISNADAVRLFELEDGRFQILDPVDIGPFLPGYGYLLVERDLADFLVAHNVDRIVCEDAVLFDRASGKEFRTHVRIRVCQYFTDDQIHDIDLTGLRLLTMNDEYYFASPDLKVLLEQASFDDLRFSEGPSGFAGRAC